MVSVLFRTTITMFVVCYPTRLSSCCLFSHKVGLLLCIFVQGWIRVVYYPTRLDSCCILSHKVAFLYIVYKIEFFLLSILPQGWIFAVYFPTRLGSCWLFSTRLGFCCILSHKAEILLYVQQYGDKGSLFGEWYKYVYVTES